MRLVVGFSYEARQGRFSPTWRANVPGFGAAGPCLGDRYAQFLYLWKLVARAIDYWQQRGCPAPVMRYLTPEDRTFLEEAVS